MAHPGHYSSKQTVKPESCLSSSAKQLYTTPCLPDRACLFGSGSQKPFGLALHGFCAVAELARCRVALHIRTDVFRSELRYVEAELAGSWQQLVRPSNTKPCGGPTGRSFVDCTGRVEHGTNTQP